MTTERGQPIAKEAEGSNVATEELAALIVDALLLAGVIRQEDVDRAIRIAMEEIDVRRVLGDY